MAPTATSMSSATGFTGPPVTCVSSVAALVTHPGHAFAKQTQRAKTRPQCFPKRLKPVSAVSPVASVYRSISRLMNHWMTTPRTAPQRKTRPTCEAM